MAAWLRRISPLLVPLLAVGEDIGDVGEAGVLDFLLGDDLDRAFALERLQRNARAGHLDLLDLLDGRGWARLP